MERTLEGGTGRRKLAGRLIKMPISFVSGEMGHLVPGLAMQYCHLSLQFYDLLGLELGCGGLVGPLGRHRRLEL